MRIPAMLIMTLAGCTLAGPGSSGRTAQLPARSVVVGQGVAPGWQSRLDGSGSPQAGVMVLRKPPDGATRAALLESGAQLLQSLEPDVYLVLISRGARLGALAQQVVWLAPLDPVDHVDPDLWRGNPPPWARTNDGGLK